MTSKNPNQTDKTRTAVGLRYGEQGVSRNGDKVPTIVVKGVGHLADEILSLADQHNIMVHQDSGLVDMLSRLDLGQEIPPNMYHVIAELIAFSYVLQGKFPDSWENPSRITQV